jgi:co-chaperonin GroES (HSP10)
MKLKPLASLLVKRLNRKKSPSGITFPIRQGKAQRAKSWPWDRADREDGKHLHALAAGNLVLFNKYPATKSRSTTKTCFHARDEILASRGLAHRSFFHISTVRRRTYAAKEFLLTQSPEN